MKHKSTQWMIWAALMALFTALTLTQRWVDLALALTLSAVFWYGIVPGPQSDENSSQQRLRARGR